MNLELKIIIIVLSFSLQLKAQDTTSFQYQKPLFDFQPEKPVFKLQGEQLSNKNRWLRFTVITGYREGVNPFNGIAGLNFNNYRDSLNGVQRLVMYNLTIPEMLNHFPVNPHKIVLEVKDPSKYVYNPSYGSKENWIRKHAYCYEWAAPIGTLSVDLLNEHLSGLFGLQFSREKRSVPALILIRTSKIDKIKSAGLGEGKYDIHGNFNNKPITENRFSSQMDATNSMLPIVDETGYSGPVDMQLNITNWTNLIEVRKALQRYDLDLIEGIREVEVLVIRELNQEKK